MIGAIAGDIIGSIYERHNIRRVDFPLFHIETYGEKAAGRWAC